MENRKGFTIVELVVVLMVGVILTSIAMNSMSGFQSRNAVRGARDIFITMHARARAQAIEFGQVTRVSVDAAGDSIYVTRNGTVLSSTNVRDEMGVDITVPAGSTPTICMNSRGYAEDGAGCNTGTLGITFTQGAQSMGVRVLALGQVLY